jgi:hypothetical protein
LSTAQTVEHGRSNNSAICGPENRSLRNAQITCTVLAGVRVDCDLLADERSIKPADPSLRHLPNHFQAVRSEIPAASAAARTVQPSLSILSTSNCRPIGLSLALA